MKRISCHYTLLTRSNEFKVTISMLNRDFEKIQALWDDIKAAEDGSYWTTETLADHIWKIATSEEPHAREFFQRVIVSDIQSSCEYFR